jgi:hypothetical protein
MNTLAAAFVKAKRAFGPALKDKDNPHFRSKYADLGACIDAVEEALLANGLAFYQETFPDEGGVTVETVFLHESGETMRCGKLHVPAAKKDPQGYGSALTYARRYSLMAACGIAPEDDDGNAATQAMKPKPGERKANGTLQGQGTIKATDGAIEAITDPEQRKMLDSVAAEIVAMFGEGKEIDCISAYYDLPENEDKMYVWAQLANESKIRSFLRANSPHLSKKEGA